MILYQQQERLQETPEHCLAPACLWYRTEDAEPCFLHSPQQVQQERFAESGVKRPVAFQ